MNKNSAVLQGGARGSAGKGAKYLESGAVDLSGAKVQSGVQAAKGSNVQITNTTTNSGLNPADVSTLLSGIFGGGGGPSASAPGPAPISIPFLGSLTPAGAPPASPDATASSPDASAAPAATDWSKYYWIGGIVLALLVLSFFFGKNKH